MTPKQSCPVCDSGSWIELDRRSDIPIAQNLVFRDADAARNCAVGQLRMLRCRDCGFAWNALFDADLMKYDATYDNNQNFSGVFRKHVEDVAVRVTAASSAEDVTLLEVGCGQGSFLTILAGHLGGRLSTAVGFDPAWRGDGALPPNTRIVGDYFTPETARRAGASPNLVVSRHTIEHVPEPMPFLAAIRNAARPGATVLIETPTVDWILENGMFFDFFYEHCSIFNPHSLAYAMRRAGFEVERVELVFGEQYLLATAKVPLSPTGVVAELPASEEHGRFDAVGYQERRDAYIAKFREVVGASAGEGLALWGGASKGVTLALLLGEQRGDIACAIDINPAKQGGFLPGTGIPILSPAEAAAHGVDTVIVLNPNYAGEIRQQCQLDGLPFRLLTV